MSDHLDMNRLQGESVKLGIPRGLPREPVELNIIRHLYESLSDEWLTWTDVCFWLGLGFGLGLMAAWMWA